MGINLLNPPSPNELTIEEMQEALEFLIEVAQTMLDTYGSLTITWGNIHVLQRNNKIFPLSGAGGILSPLHMAHGPISNGIMYCDAGSSYMMLVQLSNPIRAWSVFPLSESNDPNSPHYSDISELYSQKRYKPAWFTKEEILANLDPIDPNPVMLILPKENKSPDIPDIDGQASGKAGEKYSYKFFTIDPDGDNVYYYIEWGDGETEKWMGPYDSGKQVIVNHTWNKKGDYVIRAKAKDTNGAESGWATLEISMPRSKQFFLQFGRIRGRFPLLEHILSILAWEKIGNIEKDCRLGFWRLG